MLENQAGNASRPCVVELCLVMVTVCTVNTQPVTVTEVLRLNPTATEMTVESVVRVEHGYQGVRPPLESGPPNMSKTTSIFRKQP